MSDGLKVLRHFLRNLDKTLKILANRKNDSLRSAIESNIKNIQRPLGSIDKQKIVEFTKANPNFLKVSGGIRSFRIELFDQFDPLLAPRPVNHRLIESIPLQQTDNAVKQIENVQLVLFSLRKYVDYLISERTPRGADYVRNIPSSISKEFLSEKNLKNLDKNLRDLTSTLTGNLAGDAPARSDDAHRGDPIRRDASADATAHATTTVKSAPAERSQQRKQQRPTKQDYKLAEQKLSERSKATKVPATRLGRIVSYGELAAGLGVGTFVELSKRQLGLSNESNRNPFFNDANANRIVKTLCKVRGAALKIGQILSIQDMISPELARIFERVRQSADYMPEYQLRSVLNDQLGTEWRSSFKEFDLKPFAAASIGQVHKATLNDGREVALKIQYPGVAEGIDSDLKNLVSVLKIWNVLPAGLFIDSIIKVTKKELSWELDYEREVEMCKEYGRLIKLHLKNENFKVPEVIDELCTKKVITSELVYGVPVDKLEAGEFDQAVIDDVAGRLLQLLLYEIFIFKFMQTDPNWSNFFYNPINGQISLIDFGAARSFSSEFVRKYYRILKAAAHKNEEEILKHSIDIGFLTGHENKQMIQAHVESVLILGKVFEHDRLFDFGDQDISRRIHQTVPVMLENRLIPPPDEIVSCFDQLGPFAINRRDYCLRLISFRL